MRGKTFFWPSQQFVLFSPATLGSSVKLMYKSAFAFVASASTTPFALKEETQADSGKGGGQKRGGEGGRGLVTGDSAHKSSLPPAVMRGEAIPLPSNLACQRQAERRAQHLWNFKLPLFFKYGE